MSDKTTAHSEAVAWQRRDLSQPHPQLGIQQWSHWRAIGANEFETLRDYKIANPSRKDIEVRELYPAPTHAAEIWHNALRFKALEQALGEYLKEKIPGHFTLHQSIKWRADEIMRAHHAEIAESLKLAKWYRGLRDSDPDNGEPYIARQRQDSWGNWKAEWLGGLDADRALDAKHNSAREV